MLLWLFEQLAGYDSTFQVVRYLTSLNKASRMAYKCCGAGVTTIK
jgi:hypothetical protein